MRRVLQALPAALVLAAMAPTGPAVAQGFFESLFGGAARRALPPQVSSYADPTEGSRREHSRREYRRSDDEDSSVTSGYSSGGATAYCVRTCDGRYFPLQRHAAASPAELCKSFCPASATAVFYGSKIDHAVGPNSVRYAELENAFTYRDKVVENCSCNGKDGLGLARVDIKEDESLRSGDIVATNDGLTVMRNGRSKSAQFTPITPSSREWSSRLRGVKVMPAPPTLKITPVAEAPALKPARKKSRSAQSR
jgi:hypothetical protein